jgi:DNA primase
MVAVMLGGDEAGRSAAPEIEARLVRSVMVRIIDLPDGKQPDQLSVDETRDLLDDVF